MFRLYNTDSHSDKTAVLKSNNSYLPIACAFPSLRVYCDLDTACSCQHSHMRMHALAFFLSWALELQSWK